nr:MAG TPA: hypothetical protein [Caudoviricetes sp.]
MTPKEAAFLVAGSLAALASLTIVVAGIIGAAIYKRLGVPPPENYDDGNLPGCLLRLGTLLALLTGLPTLGVLAWCAIRALITVLGLAPILAPLTQP